MKRTLKNGATTPVEADPEKLAEVLRDSLREESGFWERAQDIAPKLRLLALGIFALAALSAAGLWLLQSAAEGQKAARETAVETAR